MPSITTWITAFRLRTLPLALASIAMGGFIAATYQVFTWTIFSWSVITTLCLQILSNLANDYGDSQHGADSAFRTGPSRAVQAGSISAGAMKTAIILCGALSLTSGIVLLLLSFSLSYTFLFFLLLGLLAITAAIKYTAGENPYGYAGLGDISVFFFFGWVGVCGSLYLYLHRLPASALLPGSTIGFFSVAVLNLNNIRDINADSLAGKKSIPVRVGLHYARVYHLILLVSGVMSAIVYSYLQPERSSWWFVLVLPLLVLNGWKVCQVPPHLLDPYLKQMAITTLLFVLVFGVGTWV